MDLSLEIQTAQNVPLALEPASVGERVLATLADGAIVVANVAAVVWLDVDAVDVSAGSDHGADEADIGGSSRAGVSSGIDVRNGGSVDGPGTVVMGAEADEAAGDEGGRVNDRGASMSSGSPPSGERADADELPGRLIVETGSGADLRGEDDTRAARRAVSDALRHSSLSLFGSLGIDAGTMLVELRIGVQRPAAIDVAALAAEVPHGRVSVSVETGGLDVHDVEHGTRIVVATAAVVARLPLPPGRFVLGSS